MHLSANSRPLRVLVALCLSVFTAAGQKAKATNDRAADEAAIHENIRLMEQGWNARQGSLFAKPFAEDADYVVINGNQIKGRDKIERDHQRIFDTIYKNTTLRLSIKQIRFLRPDVALVHVNTHLDWPEGGPRDGIITMVMAKDSRGWEIAAFQNTQVTLKVN